MVAVLELSQVDGGAAHPGRHRPRPPAQRHLRARAAADVRLPRGRGQPRPPAASRDDAGPHATGRGDVHCRGFAAGEPPSVLR